MQNEMNDSIRRKTAINTVRAMYERCDTGDITDYRDMMYEAFMVLPPVQGQQWIPVSEKLPEEGIVLVACGKDGDALYVASADAVRESAYQGYVKAWMQIEPWKGKRI